MTTMIVELLLAVNNSLAGSILAKVTLTTALALVVTRLARRRRAAVRHVLLASAFAVLLALPIVAILAPSVRVAVPIAAAAVPASSAVVAIDEAIPSDVVAVRDRAVDTPPTPRRSPAFSISAIVLAGWGAGVALFLLPVVVGLWQVRSLRRSGLPWRQGRSVVESLARDAGIRRRVEVLRHESLLGPMTCGLVHAAIVLPLEADTWNEEDLRRAIVHELEHVRRGDWLSHGLARAVCAVYWFHPLVWIAWRQLALEAERACDDAVLRRADATAYADQLVGLASRLSTGTHAPLLAMANRADLPTRVRAVLDSQQRRGRAGAWSVGLACAAAALLVATVSPLRMVADAQLAFVEPSSARPKFSVASIKPCNAEAVVPGSRGGGAGRGYHTLPGRLNVDCMNVAGLIGIAVYNTDPLTNHVGDGTESSEAQRYRGGPKWLYSADLADRYTIEAIADGTPDQKVMLGPMLMRLLEDRFQLKAHRGVEEAPMYAVTVAKGGLKLRPVLPGDCTTIDPGTKAGPGPGETPLCDRITRSGFNGPNSWMEWNGPLDILTYSYLTAGLDRYVLNKTGVTGKFFGHLEYAPDDNAPYRKPRRPRPVDPSSNVPPGPSIFTALEQMGLKLESTKGPRGFLVIDHVERPSRN